MNSLLTDFHSTFCHARALATLQMGSLGVESVALLSQRYREAIRRAIHRQNSSTRSGYGGADDATELADSLLSANLIWSLFEAVCFRPGSHSVVVDLMEWARDCFPAAGQLLNQLLDDIEELHQDVLGGGGNTRRSMLCQEDLEKANGRPEHLGHYWNGVIRAVLVADFTSAVTLLKCHSKYRADRAYQRMADLLVEMQNAYGQLANVAEGPQKQHKRQSKMATATAVDDFAEVQRRIQQLLTSGFFHNYDSLMFICSLLTGQRACFHQCAETLGIEWFELLPAYLLYVEPAAEGPREVRQLADELYADVVGKRKGLHGKRANNEDSNQSLFDRTVLAILSMDCLQALQLICRSGYSSWWLATHLVDLLHYHDPAMILAPGAQLQYQSILQAAGGMDSTDLSSTQSTEQKETDLRSRILLEYGQLLLKRGGELWEMAADYLTTGGNGEEGNRLLSNAILNVDWSRNVVGVGEHLCSLCDKHELLAAKEELTQAITHHYIALGEWSSALGWALRNASIELVARVARRIFLEVKPERIARMRVFDAMSDAFLVAPELVLLYKFYNYKRHVLEGQLGQAAHLLHQIVADTSVPADFHAVLYEEMVRMLNANEQLREELYRGGMEKEGTLLDKVVLTDLLRAVSIFQLQMRVRDARDEGQSNSHGGSGSHIFHTHSRERLDEVLKLLRSLLAQELAAASR